MYLKLTINKYVGLIWEAPKIHTKMSKEQTKAICQRLQHQFQLALDPQSESYRGSNVKNLENFIQK